MTELNIQIKPYYILYDEENNEYFKVTSVANHTGIIVKPLVLDEGVDLKEYITNIRTNKANEFYTFFELRRLGFNIRIDR